MNGGFMQQLQIVDLDGCISDDRWRRDLIAPRPADGSNPENRFKAYQTLSFSDAPANLNELRADCDLIILTARPTRYAKITRDWLHIHKIKFAHLIMRNDGDTRPSWLVKEQMLGWLFDPNMYDVRPRQIVDAIDDLDPIVAMYRNYDLPARIVRIGEEEHIA